MKLTGRQATVGGLLLALVLAVIGARLFFFPPLDDAIFAMETRSLQRAPAGLAVLRPTHFAFLRGMGVLDATVPHGKDREYWMVGRNAPLRAVIATAFNKRLSRVTMPAGAPTRNFDFLVTFPDKPRDHLQSAIRHRLGYVAHPETRQTAVLALKVLDTRLPGLTLSGADEKSDITQRDSELRFTHLTAAVLARVLDQLLPTPVVDETGLTDIYNFAIPWNSRTADRMRNGEIDRAGVNQMLAGLGLGLEPDTASVEMLVVAKAK